jgi:hypothetical protein
MKLNQKDSNIRMMGFYVYAILFGAITKLTRILFR